MAEKVLYNSGCEFCSNQNHLCECGLGGEPLREDCIKGKTEWLSQEEKEDTVNIPLIGKMPKTDKEWLKEVERKNEEYSECEDDEFAQALVKESNECDEINIPSELHIKRRKHITMLTEQSYKDILSRLDRLEDNDKMNCDEFREINKRIKTLEKCNRIAEVKEHIEERLEEETKDLTKNMQPTTQEDYYEREELYQLDKGEFKSIPKSADEMFEELGYKRITSNEAPIITYEYKGKGEDNIFIHISKHYYKKCDRYSTAILILKDEDKAIHKKISELKEQKNEKKG